MKTIEAATFVRNASQGLWDVGARVIASFTAPSALSRRPMKTRQPKPARRTPQRFLTDWDSQGVRGGDQEKLKTKGSELHEELTRDTPNTPHD